jgi:hypothetical protein
VCYQLAVWEADLLQECISIASSGITHRQRWWWLPVQSPPLLLSRSLMASAIHHLCMLQLSHLQWHLAPIAWSHSLPWLLLPCKFKWQLTSLKFLFHCLLPLSDFIRARGCQALEAQRSDGIPWGSRCNISKWVVTGPTAAFIRWRVHKDWGGGAIHYCSPPSAPAPPHRILQVL